MPFFRRPFWLKARKPTPRDASDEARFSQRFNRTYQMLSSAPVDVLWQRLVDLADVSWHPLIISTDVPQGLTVKPGLTYRVVPRWLPIPIRIFVERVSPQEVFSVRLFPVPGLEERVVYQLESTVWGTQISYSVMLRGWLSPVAWSFLKSLATQVTIAMAAAAEQATLQALAMGERSPGLSNH